MTNIDLTQSIGLPLLDLPAMDADRDNLRPDRSASFNDYLQRAKTNSPDRLGNKKEASQTPAPQTESTPSQEENQPSAQADYQTSGESPGEDAHLANYNKSQTRNVENKPESPENKAAISQTEEGVEKAHKSESDGPDSSATNENQANQSVVPLNPQAIQASDANDTITEAEIKQIPETLTAVMGDGKPEEVKSIAGADALTAMESLMSNKPQAAGLEEKAASVSQSDKGKILENNALAQGVNGPGEKSIVDHLSADQQSAEILSTAAAIKNSTITKTADIRGVSGQEAGRKSTNDISASIAPLANAMEPLNTISATPPPALLSEVNLQTRLSKTTQAEVVAQKTNTTSNNNADILENIAATNAPSATKAAPGASPSSGADIGLQFDRARFVQRVEQAFAAIGDRGGSLRLKLSPPELGSLRLEITVRKGELKARVEAETKDVKNLLLENLPALRERLAQQNIKIQKFDVDLRDPSLGGTPQQTGQQSETQSNQSGYGAQRAPAQDDSETSPTSSPMIHLADHSGQLNVIV